MKQSTNQTLILPSFFDFDLSEDDDSNSNLPETTTTRSYADIVNSRFHKSKSHYISLADLLSENTQRTYDANSINTAKSIFHKKFNNIYREWSDLLICSALEIPLSKILIDVTLQRKLKISHVSKILGHFNENAVMPINLYEDPSMPGYYICFDGMHTAVTLYIIAEMLGLEDNLDNCIVPGALYRTRQKSIIRYNFVYLNSEGKERLEPIDFFHQELFGVRTDGSTYPLWLLTDQKQQQLEKYGMFATNTKFGDTDQPGALPVLTELTDNKYDISITRQFCKYFNAICNSSRPVNAKESWLFYEFFNACKQSNINVEDGALTDDEYDIDCYILELAQTLNTVYNGNFNALDFYSDAKNAYDKWWLATISRNGNLQGISRSEKAIGSVYLNAVLAKHSGLELPLLANATWAPDPAHVK
jgi:hypothetical protein